jgi:polar amino acid transport system substrate-binding protein
MLYRSGLRSAVPLLVILLTLYLLPAVPLFAQSARIVMVTEHWPPFRMNDEASPCGFSGIDIEVMDKLSQVLGVAIEIQRHPWARALELMRNGQADMITGIARTAEREEFMHYIPISYADVLPVFYTQKGKGHLVQSYEDLYGPSVGYSLKSAYFEPFNSDAKINKVGLSTEVQMLHVLALGRIDILIGTDPNMTYEVSRLGYRDVLEPTAWQPPAKTELFIALSRRSPVMERAGEIEGALRQLLEDGAIDAILGAYR